MIDPDTGALAFEQPKIQIGSSLRRAEFLAAHWSSGVQDSVINEPWHSWTLAGQYVSASIPFVVLLSFHGERLDTVNLVHHDPKFSTSWNDYSVEKEMYRNASHEQWLSACIGTLRSFSWGSVWSGLDERGGSSSIEVRYDHH